MRHRSVTYSHPGAGHTGAAPARDAAFNALADPTRRAVLDLLRAGTRPAGEIARAFPVSRPAISKHLRILRRAHLVEERKEGRHRLYQLNPEPLKAVDSWLEEYRQFWTASLENLKSFVEAEYQKELSGSTSTEQKNSDSSVDKIHSRRKDI
ncbi:MAG TPA: metalloregulator ArsR/SmtB family transcription factor [Terriglobales bacterium]|nr:metalloregulator ArsR/SmtB family transcription factor [Terriglobales bacterium]